MVTLAVICVAIVEGAVALSAHAKRPLSSRRAYRMGMPVQKRKYTVDDLDAMPEDGNRVEIIDGELFVTPPPIVHHQRAQMALIAQLVPFVRSMGAELLAAPTGVRVSRFTQVEPDLLAVARMTDIDESTRYISMSRLLLAIEVLSPSTRTIDRDRKRRLYVSEGVREYWTVDTKKRIVEVWTAATETPRVLTETLRWQPLPDCDALTIDLVALFKEVYA